MGYLAYFIMAHHLPEQLQRLVLTLIKSSPRARVILHIDTSKKEIDPALFESIPGVHVLNKPVEGKWGDFSTVEIVIAGLRWIYENMDADWIFLLSGQDYPIMNLVSIERFYERTQYDAFISAVSLEDKVLCDPVGCGKGREGSMACVCKDCNSRYYYRYYDISWMVNMADKSKITRFLMRRFIERYSEDDLIFRIRKYPPHKGGNTFIGIRNRKLFNGSFRCYKGFSWFAMNYRCLKKVLQFMNQNPRFIKHYKRTIVPDESFFPTILFNLHDIKVCNDSYRFILWRNHRAANPEILKDNHYDIIVNSGKHFARKFDHTIDHNILNRIDEYIVPAYNTQY